MQFDVVDETRMTTTLTMMIIVNIPLYNVNSCE